MGQGGPKGKASAAKSARPMRKRQVQRPSLSPPLRSLGHWRKRRGCQGPQRRRLTQGKARGDPPKANEATCLQRKWHSASRRFGPEGDASDDMAVNVIDEGGPPHVACVTKARLDQTNAKADPAKATTAGSDPGSKTKDSKKAMKSKGNGKAFLLSVAGPAERARNKPV